MAAKNRGLVVLMLLGCHLGLSSCAKTNCKVCPTGIGAASQICAAGTGEFKPMRSFDSVCDLERYNCLNADDTYIFKNSGACAFQIAKRFSVSQSTNYNPYKPVQPVQSLSAVRPVQSLSAARPLQSLSAAQPAQARQSWPAMQTQMRRGQQPYTPTQTWPAPSTYPVRQSQNVLPARQSSPWSALPVQPAKTTYSNAVPSVTQPRGQALWQRQTYQSPAQQYFGSSNYQYNGPYSSAFNNNGYSNNGYSNNGYSNNGYSNNGYSNNGYYGTSWYGRQSIQYQPFNYDKPILSSSNAYRGDGYSSIPWRYNVVRPFAAYIPLKAITPPAPAPAPTTVLPTAPTTLPPTAPPTLPPPAPTTLAPPAPTTLAPPVPTTLAPPAPTTLAPPPPTTLAPPAPTTLPPPAPTTLAPPAPTTLAPPAPTTLAPPAPTTLPPPAPTTLPPPPPADVVAALLNYDSYQCSTETAADGSTQACVIATPPKRAGSSTKTGCGWVRPTFCNKTLEAAADILAAGRTPDPVPPGYDLLPGVGYYKFHPEARLLTDAANVCKKEGTNTHLAIFSQPSDYDAVWNFIKPNVTTTAGVYVGYWDKPDEGTFITITGQPACQLSPMIFNPGEPNNGGTGEDCVMIGFGDSPYMNDTYCPTPHPFLCEQTLPSRAAICTP